MEYPILGKPDYNVENKDNPYGGNQDGSQRGEPYTSNLVGQSTMVSDSVEMTKRMKRWVPRTSMKEGREPQVLQTPGEVAQEVDGGGDYKSKYQ